MEGISKEDYKTNFKNKIINPHDSRNLKNHLKRLEIQPADS